MTKKRISGDTLTLSWVRLNSHRGDFAGVDHNDTALQTWSAKDGLSVENEAKGSSKLSRVVSSCSQCHPLDYV